MKNCKQIATEWGLSERTVNDLCKKNKIDGAIKVGKMWKIPDDAKKPIDGRITSGKYTLRLLAAQQFTRASTLICACEYIRVDATDKKPIYGKYDLGAEPITILPSRVIWSMKGIIMF